MKILLLPGDGVGPEVTTQARAVLELVGAHMTGLELETADFGGCACDSHGEPLPAKTLASAQEADAVLLGAVGGPQYDNLPHAERPEQGLLGLRKGLEVFANLRPIKVFDKLAGNSSLRGEVTKGIDLIIVRELIGGIYFGTPRGIDGDGDERVGFNTMRYSVKEVKRIAQIAFNLAKQREKKSVCSVDKANVLEVSRLWREVVTEFASEHPDIQLSHLYVDNAAMQLVRSPKSFDVILTGNLFGDILSDLGAELAGSIGMLPSASLGSGAGLFEPVHGSAPDIAGQNKANPCGAILSVALMLEASLGQPELAGKLRNAVSQALEDGYLSTDLHGSSQAKSCSEVGEAICERLRKSLG